MKIDKGICCEKSIIINFSISFIDWVVPENIHIYTTGSISEFRGGGGVYVDWNSEDMGGFIGLEFRRDGGFIGLEFRRHGGIFRTVTSSLV